MGTSSVPLQVSANFQVGIVIVYLFQKQRTLSEMMLQRSEQLAPTTFNHSLTMGRALHFAFMLAAVASLLVEAHPAQQEYAEAFEAFKLRFKKGFSRAW